VPAKKTRQPGKTGKAVYLLSADRKFRRLSLKKISERVKGARRRTRGRSIAKAATAGEPPSNAARNPAPAKIASIALAFAGLFLLVTLVGASWPSASSVDPQVAAAQTENAAVLTADVASAPVVRAKPLTASPAANAPRAVNALPVPAAVTSTATSRPTETPEARAEIAPVPPSPARPSAPADAHSAAAAASIDTVTISGCLDFDGKSTWLKDTSGVDAPRTRSWRSGFLRKRSPRIALVDGPTSAEAYDGRLVSVTGVLVDREMRVSSLKPIAGDCE
jgi:hypothetical protein